MPVSSNVAASSASDQRAGRWIRTPPSSSVAPPATTRSVPRHAVSSPPNRHGRPMELAAVPPPARSRLELPGSAALASIPIVCRNAPPSMRHPPPHRSSPFLPASVCACEHRHVSRAWASAHRSR
ncbi:COPII coat assembly protein sec16 [Triticum aestivum]|uniref:COPII coat assembly protein sec16 n=1 Tax=Triticum aestivum TaxID=4565 RepID=UPI001D017467|nr:COPII coat assembly protein sec16-like [Triticum aestivum]